jgi:hypothetical protein
MEYDWKKDVVDRTCFEIVGGVLLCRVGFVDFQPIGIYLCRQSSTSYVIFTVQKSIVLQYSASHHVIDALESNYTQSRFEE